MKCPTCPDTALVMSERQGVEIDYCPQCRGVWLYRGELDKLIERATTSAVPDAAAQGQGRTLHRDFVDSDHDPRRQRHVGTRRKSWLSEIFD